MTTEIEMKSPSLGTPPPSGVTSLNSLTGALVLASPNSTLTITPVGFNINEDIDLAHPNTWTGLQTFGNKISFGTLQVNVVTPPTVGQVLGVTAGGDWANISLPSQEWTAGAVSGLGSGLSISGTTLEVTFPSQEWSAGAVATLSSGLSIIGTELVVTFPTAEWQAGTVTSLSSGLSIVANVLTVTFPTVVTSLGAQTGAILLSSGLSMVGSTLTVTFPSQEWTAGNVATVGGGISISGTELISQWSAGAVASLSSGLSIVGTVLTVTFPTVVTSIGTVTGAITLSSGLSMVASVLTVTFPTVVTSLGAQTGAITLSTGLSMAASVLTAQWQAGLVTSLSSGLSIAANVLTVTFPSQEWTAGAVASLSSGLSIVGTVLTVTFPTVVTSIGTKTGAITLGSGLSMSLNQLDVTFPTVVTSLGAQTGAITLSSGLSMVGSVLTVTFPTVVTSLGAQTGAITLSSGLSMVGSVLTVTFPSAAVSSVSNSDGTLTISPTTGAVVASIASLGVATGNIAALAVTTAKIAALAVTAEKMGNVVRLTSDTASIIGTKSSGLTWSLLANTNYIFKAYLYITITGPPATAANFQIHALASGAALEWASGFAGANDYTSVASGDETAIITAVTTNIFATYIGITASMFVEIKGLITVGATPTTLQIDYEEKQTGDAVKAGSFMEVSAVA